ncbi:MAG: energy-coupled thiamine transporter ThiT [Clostridia bacterium]|nr:energy-coupled thiamine transporter ThiT [Clostridia bacterium]
MKRDKLRMLVEIAIMVALSTVLSLIRIIKLPYGGSVTLLSMLPICLISIKYGLGAGLAAGFMHSVIQLLMDLAEVMSWGLSALVLVGCIFLDYLLAYTILGIAGMFRGKKFPGWMGGIAAALFGRFVMHFLSGFILWGSYAADYGFSSPVLYSLAYNGLYMGLELVFTLVAAAILFNVPVMKRMLAPTGKADKAEKAEKTETEFSDPFDGKDEF